MDFAHRPATLALRLAGLLFAAALPLAAHAQASGKLDRTDAPVFLDIASAINSYSLETNVSVAAGFQTPLAPNANALGLGEGSKSIDRPSINGAA